MLLRAQRARRRARRVDRRMVSSVHHLPLYDRSDGRMSADVRSDLDAVVDEPARDLLSGVVADDRLTLDLDLELREAGGRHDALLQQEVDAPDAAAHVLPPVLRGTSRVSLRDEVGHLERRRVVAGRLYVRAHVEADPVVRVHRLPREVGRFEPGETVFALRHRHDVVPLEVPDREDGVRTAAADDSPVPDDRPVAAAVHRRDGLPRHAWRESHVLRVDPRRRAVWVLEPRRRSHLRPRPRRVVRHRRSDLRVRRGDLTPHLTRLEAPVPGHPVTLVPDVLTDAVAVLP